MWRQGEESHTAILVVYGQLLSTLEEEVRVSNIILKVWKRKISYIFTQAGAIECILPGHLVGEYGLISKYPRFGTLVAIEPSEVGD